ncbi:FGFR1 oncogene partner 2 homolog [Parasteatoda tepidariorum]|uniref:FGFR1 oncogene partner 2 homolog n=1 Tax=Parasteatoda tepidariorum TaxID=114398 RepID=UPI00077FADF9|nr:FGFR1 oncogene partner 2 homolog [Parasteatoda tepidariorum]
MSVTVHQILNDAKRLVNRLREHESSADNIIQQTQTLYKNIDAMKEYNEEVNDQNMANQVRPPIVFNAQQENKHIKDLLQENKELRDMLEEHQSVLELIMSKYRQQVTELVNSCSLKNDGSYMNNSQELQKMADNICEIADVMKQAVKIDDVSYINEIEKLTELVTENYGLRELLDISKTFGSLHNPLNTPEMSDKEIQTDV